MVPQKCCQFIGMVPSWDHIYTYIIYMYMLTDLLPAHKSGVGWGGVGNNVHATLLQSSLALYHIRHVTLLQSSLALYHIRHATLLQSSLALCHIRHAPLMGWVGVTFSLWVGTRSVYDTN